MRQSGTEIETEQAERESRETGREMREEGHSNKNEDSNSYTGTKTVQTLEER